MSGKMLILGLVGLLVLFCFLAFVAPMVTSVGKILLCFTVIGIGSLFAYKIFHSKKI